jgi:hypothetical protein
MFNVYPSGQNFPSARCTSAAIVVCMDADVFRIKTIPLNYIS